MSIEEDVLIHIFSKMTPEMLLKCERVCKSWCFYLTVKYDTRIWKNRLIKDTVIWNGIKMSIAVNCINSIKVLHEERWRTIYRTWYEWSQPHLPFNELSLTQPILISATENQFPLNFKSSRFLKRPNLAVIDDLLNLATTKVNRRVKLGRINTGSMSFPINIPKDLQQTQQLWFNETEESITYGLDLQQWQQKQGQAPSVCVLSFAGRPSGSSIKLIPHTRSDLLILQESYDNVSNVVIRIWNPILHPNGPWVVDHSKKNIPGIWIIDGQLKCIALCGRILVCRAPFTGEQENDLSPDDFDYLRIYKLQDEVEIVWANEFCQNISNSKIELLWERSINIDSYSINEVSLNEYVLAISYSTSPLLSSIYISLLDLISGEDISNFSIDVPTFFGQISSDISITLTRFHLIVYNWTHMLVYDIMKCMDRQRNPFYNSISRLPYVGRKIRVDISEDASLFMLAPTIQKGEVVVVNMLQRKYSTYLLTDGFSGSHPKKGCWLVFEERDCHKKEARVDWTPINLASI